MKVLTLVLLAMLPVVAMDAHMRDRNAPRPRQTAGPPIAQWADRTVWDSVYSPAQATRGETAYVKSCARCHGASLSGGDQATPLAGSAFLGNWNGLPLSDLQRRIKTTMPSDSVGIYDRQLVTDVIAYLLKVNTFPAGAADLPTDLDALSGIVVRTSRPGPTENGPSSPR
ncbi:MAG TPA: cytochrome c [Gemmatimonadaceae bacterium]